MSRSSKKKFKQKENRTKHIHINHRHEDKTLFHAKNNEDVKKNAQTHKSSLLRFFLFYCILFDFMNKMVMA